MPANWSWSRPISIFCCTGHVNLRAGMLLVPVGIINERHEPPVFNGVERPFVDTVIVPTTWFDVGVGIHGEVGNGFRYRAYAMAPLDALEFTAEDGIREGRQKGARSNVRNLALTARGEYVGVRDLTVGASVWTGRLVVFRCSPRHHRARSWRPTPAFSAGRSSPVPSSPRSASATPDA